MVAALAFCAGCGESMPRHSADLGQSVHEAFPTAIDVRCAEQPDWRCIVTLPDGSRRSCAVTVNAQSVAEGFYCKKLSPST